MLIALLLLSPIHAEAASRSGEVQINPEKVGQTGTYNKRHAKYSIDGNLTTYSHSDAPYNKTNELTITLGRDYCLTRIVIINGLDNEFFIWFNGTEVLLLNRKGITALYQKPKSLIVWVGEA